KKTFSLKYYSIALNYDLTLKSIYDETSTFLIKGDFNEVKAGDFLFADNNAFLVKQADKDSGLINITCEGIENLFSRDIPTQPPAITESIENYTKKLIDSLYKNQQDVIYEMPFI